MGEDISQLVDACDSIVKLSLQVPNLLVRVIFVVLWQSLHAILRRLHLGECLTSLIDVIDRANDLANLLLILVFVLNLVLEVELERLVLPRDVLDLLLQLAHVTLL